MTAITTIKGLLSKPKALKTELPGVIVVQENRGLNLFIKDLGPPLQKVS